MHTFLCIHSITKILLLTSITYYSEDFCMQYWSIAFNLFSVIVKVAFLEDISEVRCIRNTFIFYWKLSTETFILFVED